MIGQSSMRSWKRTGRDGWMYCCRNSLGDKFFPDTGGSNVEWWNKEENEDSVGSSRVVVVQGPGHCERTLALATRTSSPNVESMSAWTKFVIAGVPQGVPSCDDILIQVWPKVGLCAPDFVKYISNFASNDRTREYRYLL